LTYKILSINPLAIEEVIASAGDLCGSVCVDQLFGKLVQDRLGRMAESVLKRSKESLSQQFESIKLHFNPYDDDVADLYPIAVGEAPDIPQIGLQEGYLRLTRYLHPRRVVHKRDNIQNVFDPVFTKILALIQNQISAVRVSSQETPRVLCL